MKVKQKMRFLYEKKKHSLSGIKDALEDLGLCVSRESESSQLLMCSRVIAGLVSYYSSIMYSNETECK